MAEELEQEELDVPEPDEALLVVWKRLHEVICGWKGQLWRNLISSKNSWLNLRRQVSDPISSYLAYSHWKKLREICAPLSDVDIDYLRVLAQQKFEYSAAQFRFNVVMFITLPVTAAVVFNQLSPDLFGQFLAFWDSRLNDEKDDVWVNLLIAGLAVGTVLLTIGALFNSVYKARELRMALELEAARRRLKRGETLASAGGDTTEVSV